MNNLAGLIKNYTMRHSKKLHNLCLPLQDSLGIYTFSYYSIEDDGRFVFLSNNPDQADFYYSNKMYLNNPFLVHPDLLRSGYTRTIITPSQEYKTTNDVAYGNYFISDPLLMLIKSEKRIEGFFFGGDTRQKYQPDYLEYLEMLKKFVGYFTQEAQPLIRHAQGEDYNLYVEKGTAFLERKSQLPLAAQDPRIDAFLRSICPLSKREEQCLELYKKGHSAQSTAAILGISQRTVEHYFENIKIKLGCFSKLDLLNR